MSTLFGIFNMSYMSHVLYVLHVVRATCPPAGPLPKALLAAAIEVSFADGQLLVSADACGITGLPQKVEVDEVTLAMLAMIK